MPFPHLPATPREPVTIAIVGIAALVLDTLAAVAIWMLFSNSESPTACLATASGRVCGLKIGTVLSLSIVGAAHTIVVIARVIDRLRFGKG